MLSLLCLPCKLVFLIIGGVSSFGTVFFCIPLSLFLLVVSLVIGFYGGCNAKIILTDFNPKSFDMIKELSFHLSLCLTSLFTLISVVFLSPISTSIARLFYRFVTFYAIIFSIYEIFAVFFFRDQTEQQKTTDKKELIKILILLFLLLAFSFFYLSALKSLAKVIRAGGSGWECMNHKEIKRRQMIRNQAAPPMSVPVQEL